MLIKIPVIAASARRNRMLRLLHT